MVQAGVDLVAELVGVTLGPKGRNVVLQNKYGPPKIVNDGETVLKEVLIIYNLVHFPIYQNQKGSIITAFFFSL